MVRAIIYANLICNLVKKVAGVTIFSSRRSKWLNSSAFYPQTFRSGNSQCTSSAAVRAPTWSRPRENLTSLLREPTPDALHQFPVGSTTAPRLHPLHCERVRRVNLQQGPMFPSDILNCDHRLSHRSVGCRFLRVSCMSFQQLNRRTKIALQIISLLGRNTCSLTVFRLRDVVRMKSETL